MLRLSKLTDYAVVVLVRLAGMEGVRPASPLRPEFPNQLLPRC
jgi:hypothetical protein